MEKWLEGLFAGLGWYILVAIISGGVALMISFLLHRKPIKEMRRELAELKGANRQTGATHEREHNASTDSVDYIGACAIVDSYIHSAMRDMREIDKIAVTKDFTDRFDKVTGAKLGEYEYNRKLLHQWMQSNAARFLVKHRHEML